MYLNVYIECNIWCSSDRRASVLHLTKGAFCYSASARVTYSIKQQWKCGRVGIFFQIHTVQCLFPTCTENTLCIRYSGQGFLT